ncbi:FG-GAP repeat domain-containing protein [Streptomyces sp. NPDC092369]|uniref:FG-GAP repeat domain-containing protein n=1 Tax=Streptomyces sp. NPDC092369 TaxID=3366015 RepID=UPI0037F5C587
MKRRHLLGAALVLLLAACGSDGGEAPQHPGVRSDFDGDGYGDLVVSDTTATVHGKYAAGYAAVLRGSAQGPRLKGAQVVTQDGLGLGKAGEGGGFGGSSSSLSADLDGDGRADFVTQAGRSTVFVVWGSDKGLSGAARLKGSAPLAGDVDGDGHADLVVTSGQNAVRILLGPLDRDGTPRRTVPLDLTPSDSKYPAAVPAALGDLTGDGKDDLLVTWAALVDEAPQSLATVLYRGAADGKPVKGPRLKDEQGGDFHGQVLRTADVNKDGYADVVAALGCDVLLGDPNPPRGGSRVGVLYGGPTGPSERIKPVRITERTAGLPVQGPFSFCSFGGRPAVGDVDGDGYADVVFSAEVEKGTKRELLVLRGSGEGLTLKGARALPGTSAVLLDTDGDRAAELVVEEAGEVRVVRSGAPTRTFTAADLDLGPDISGSGRGFGPVG